MKFQRENWFLNLKKIFLGVLFILIFLSPNTQAASLDNWLSTLPEKSIDIYGDSLFFEQDYQDMLQFGDFFTFKTKYHGGYYNLDDTSFQQGYQPVSGTTMVDYSIGIKSDEGWEIRFLYKGGSSESGADNQLTGFTIKDPQTGTYREFYANAFEAGEDDEFEDKFGNGSLNGLVSKYFKSRVAEHDGVINNIESALGAKFTLNGQSLSLRQKVDAEDQRSKFEDDWSKLKEIAIKNGIVDGSQEMKDLYTAILAQNLGLSLTPAQKAILDRFKGFSGVKTTNDGKVVSEARFEGIVAANSQAALDAAQAHMNSAAAGALPDNGGLCWLGVQNGIDIGNCIEQVMYFALGIMAWVLGLSVFLFNTVFEFTVIGMSKFVNSIEAINIVWKIFRDFSNILFIFILLYLAISTILGLNEHGVKHTLSKLILVAVLINFSMFFSKVVVDSSNILAISFFKKINPGTDVADAGSLTKPYIESVDEINIEKLVKEDGIAGAFMGSFRLQKIFEGENKGKTDGPQAFAMRADSGTVFIMGTIAMFITFCVFLAATIIFIKRLTTILILIMTSSLAFAATLLHKTEHMAHDWWERLLKEAFYAPIFVAVIWMAILVMTDPNFGGVFATKNAEGWFNVSTITNYIIVINFFIMALVVGEKMGVKGASGAMKAFQGLKSHLGGRLIQAGIRNTLGRAAYRLYEGKDKGGHGPKGAFKVWMEKSISKGGVMGSVAGMMKSTLKAGVNAKVGPGNNFAEDFAEKQHAMQETLIELRGDPAAQAEFLREMAIKSEKNLNIQVALEKTFEGMKGDEQAEIIAQLQKKIDLGSKKERVDFEKTKNKLLGRLSTTQRDAVDRKLEGVLPIQKENVKEWLALHENKDGIRDKTLATLHKQLSTETDTEEKKRIEKRIDEVKNPLISMRKYVGKMSTAQKVSLGKELISHPEIAPLFDGNDLEQLQRNQLLSDENYKQFGQLIEGKIDTIQNYSAARKGDDDAMKALKASVKKYAEERGAAVPEEEKDVFEYYEKNMLGKYARTAYSDNLAKFFESKKLKQGKDLIKKVEEMGTHAEAQEAEQKKQSEDKESQRKQQQEDTKNRIKQERANRVAKNAAAEFETNI